MIHIMRCVTHPTRNQPHVKGTKTESSRRDIELAAGILSYLPEGRPNDYILGGDKPLSYTRLRRMCDRIRKDIDFNEAIVPQRFRTTVGALRMASIIVWMCPSTKTNPASERTMRLTTWQWFAILRFLP